MRSKGDKRPRTEAQMQQDVEVGIGVETTSSILHIVKNPIIKSELEIVNGFTIEFPHNMPNFWWRFWQWVFFGFKWREGL